MNSLEGDIWVDIDLNDDTDSNQKEKDAFHSALNLQKDIEDIEKLHRESKDKNFFLCILFIAFTLSFIFLGSVCSCLLQNSRF